MRRKSLSGIKIAFLDGVILALKITDNFSGNMSVFVQIINTFPDKDWIYFLKIPQNSEHKIPF